MLNLLKLMELVPPPVVGISVPPSVEDGQPATFRCTVTGSSANITVYWLDENGKYIEPYAHHKSYWSMNYI